jgi:hypothetical protein
MKYKIAAIVALGSLYGLPANGAPPSKASTLSQLAAEHPDIQKVEHGEHEHGDGEHHDHGDWDHGDWHDR